MGYGVNRSRKRTTTRRKKRPQSSGRARSAAKRRSRVTSRKRASSARPAARKRRSSSRKRSRTTSTRSTRTRKPRQVTRYDPEFGKKVKVDADSWEALNWPSRKPSIKRQRRAQLAAAPLATLGTIAATAGKKSIERAGETAVKTALRSAKAAGLAEVGLTAAGVGAAATSAAILAAGYVVMSQVAAHGTIGLGDKLNAISNRFVETQRQLIKQYGRTWDDVPQKIRDQALLQYRQAISTASAQGRGSANVTRPVDGSYK